MHEVLGNSTTDAVLLGWPGRSHMAALLDAGCSTILLPPTKGGFLWGSTIMDYIWYSFSKHLIVLYAFNQTTCLPYLTSITAFAPCLQPEKGSRHPQLPIDQLFSFRSFNPRIFHYLTQIMNGFGDRGLDEGNFEASSGLSVSAFDAFRQ